MRLNCPEIKKFWCSLSHSNAIKRDHMCKAIFALAVNDVRWLFCKVRYQKGNLYSDVKVNT